MKHYKSYMTKILKELQKTKTFKFKISTFEFPYDEKTFIAQMSMESKQSIYLVKQEFPISVLEKYKDYKEDIKIILDAKLVELEKRIYEKSN